MTENLTRIPLRSYTDVDRYNDEIKKIVQGKTWHFIGFESEIQNAGDYSTTEIAEIPVVVLNDAGVVRAYVNRCVHRGSFSASPKKAISNSSSAYTMAGHLT